MRTQGTGNFLFQYAVSLAICRLLESALPSTTVWQPMQVLTAGMPGSSPLLLA